METLKKSDKEDLKNALRLTIESLKKCYSIKYKKNIKTITGLNKCLNKEVSYQINFPVTIFYRTNDSWRASFLKRIRIGIKQSGNKILFKEVKKALSKLS